MFDIFTPRPQASSPTSVPAACALPQWEWPAALRNVLRAALASPQPACVLWGPRLATYCNDACGPLLGGVPAAGRPAEHVWRILWAELGPRTEAALCQGEGSISPALRLLVQRAGRLQEAHYTVALSPVIGDTGTADGVLCVFCEVTAAVVCERQMRLLDELAAQGRGVATVEAALERAAQALAGDAADLPFSGIYLVEAGRREARLVACAGIAAGHEAMPAELRVDAGAPWPLGAVLETGGVLALDLANTGSLPCGPWPRPPREGRIAALGPVGHGRQAVLVAALSPVRPAGGPGERLVERVAAQVGAALANAQALDEERRRLEAETLQEVARDIASELDLPTVVQKVTDAGVALTGARFGAFFQSGTAEDGSRRLELHTLSGGHRPAFEPLGHPRVTPLFKATYLGQGPVRAADVTLDPRFGQLQPHFGLPPGHPEVRSYLAVPVVSRTGEVLGGLVFGHERPAMFDARAERNALGIAAHAAVAIDNAHLYGQARREIERRSAMERELRESEARYRELVEALPAAVYTTDAHGRIQLYNEAAVALWGREPQAGVDKWCGAARLFDAGGGEVALDQCLMAHVLRDQPQAAGEIVVERPDGTRRHVLASPTAIRDARGRIAGAVNMLVDITGRKAAEAELAAIKDQLGRQVERLGRLHELAMRLGGIAELKPALQAILDTAAAAQGARMGIVWMHDPASQELTLGASCRFPDEALRHFQRIPASPEGGAAGNAFARHARWVIPDTEADEAFAAYRPYARRAGFRAVHSTPIVTRGGELLGVLSVHYPQPRQPSQGDMQVADVCARHAADVIEAFRSQAALRESERLYRAIGESLDYGIWMADARGRNTYTSEALLRLMGVSQERWAGLGWKELVHPEDAPALAARWERCLAEGALFDQEFRVRCADGSWRAVLARGVPVRDDAGRVTAWTGINLDIERLKRVENELRELDQRKDEFLATLAHELRNPLAPLRNGLEVMRLASGSAELVEKARGMMERQLAQMVRLVDDLLDVSRVSRGKIELRRQPVELAAVLRNAMETSQPLMSQRDHRLEVRVPPERIVVDADLTRLAQVFWNLLNNAAKYTEPGGHIRVAARLVPGAVEVSIRDNGIGIPPDMQGRVFDIFTQIDRSLEKSQGGLGIGLSIAKRLVEMHGGTIRVTSEGHRKGSEFVVCLPASVEPASPAPREGGAPSAAAARHRILVADDNADTAATLQLMLEVLGHEVRVARDGEEAARGAIAWRPDAVLLDIAMPRLNGYDACERIRRAPGGAETFIVALTGWGQEEDRRRAIAAGFNRHLVKPVEPAMLEEIIREVPVRR